MKAILTFQGIGELVSIEKLFSNRKIIAIHGVLHIGGNWFLEVKIVLEPKHKIPEIFQIYELKNFEYKGLRIVDQKLLIRGFGEVYEFWKDQIQELEEETIKTEPLDFDVIEYSEEPFALIDEEPLSLYDFDVGSIEVKNVYYAKEHITLEAIFDAGNDWKIEATLLLKLPNETNETLENEDFLKLKYTNVIVLQYRILQYSDVLPRSSFWLSCFRAIVLSH